MRFFKEDTLLQEDVEIIEINPIHEKGDKKKLYSIEVESEDDRYSVYYFNYDDFDVVIKGRTD